MMQRPYALSCHCGAIRFAVDADLGELIDCNCSTCGRSGFLHWKVPAASVRLLTVKVGLSHYLWRDAVGGHHFCPTCGTAIMRTGYAGGMISLNARCIEGVDVHALKIVRYDGLREMP